MSDLGNKQVMAQNIKYYLDLNNIDRNRLCRDLGFKYSTFSNWMQGVAYPRIDKIEMMANYFGISKADLVERRDTSIEPDPEPVYYNDPRARDLAEFLYKNPDYSVLFDAAKNVSREDLEIVKAMLEGANRNKSTDGESN